MFEKPAHALRYLFYRSYAYQLKQWKGDIKTAAVAATMAIAVAIYINALTVVALVLSFLHKRMPSEIAILPGLPPIKVAYMAGVGGLIFARIMYVFYTKNGRNHEIIKEYSKEDLSVRRTRSIYIYSYTIATAACFIISLAIAFFSTAQ